MPQLDLAAYFSEYLWTLLSFFTLYSLLSKFFLPRFARALLFEQKKYTGNGQSTKSPKKEDGYSIQLWNRGNNLLENVFFQKHILSRNFARRHQKKTEVCTIITEELQALHTKKNGESLHQSFLVTQEEQTIF